MATNFQAHDSAFFRLSKANGEMKKIPCEIVLVRRNGDFTARFHSYETECTVADYSKYETKSGSTFAFLDYITTFKEYHPVAGEKHLIDWIREILIDFVRPMHYSEIRAELLKRGYVCPIVESEERTPIECRIKTRIIDNLKYYGNHDIAKVGKATYQYVG